MPSKKKVLAEKPAFSGGYPSAHLEKRTKLRLGGLKGGKLQDALEQQLAVPASKAKRARKVPSTAAVVAGGLRLEREAAAAVGLKGKARTAAIMKLRYVEAGCTGPDAAEQYEALMVRHDLERQERMVPCAVCEQRNPGWFDGGPQVCLYCRPSLGMPDQGARCQVCGHQSYHMGVPWTCATCAAVERGHQAGQAEVAAVLAAEGVELPVQSRSADLSKLLVRVPPPEPHAGGMREFTANRTRAAVYLRLPPADLQAIEADCGRACCSSVGKWILDALAPAIAAARAVQARELEAVGVQPALEAAV